jgi:hypothetical protein
MSFQKAEDFPELQFPADYQIDPYQANEKVET